jgi:signal peptidase II
MLVTLLLDRCTKYFVLKYVDKPVKINSFFSLVLTFNRGFSWSMFHSPNNIIFCIVSSIIFFITACIACYAYHLYKKEMPIIGELLVTVGSISNCIDRVLYGGVVDFLLFSYKNFAWPVFNCADVFIVAGVLIIFFGHYDEA